MRALEGIVYSVYSGSRFVLVGTPSGISLSREGGAHQSINTPGIGIETPSLAYAEPCFATELEWVLLQALRSMQQQDGESLYLRLSTKPIDQRPFAQLVARRGEAAVRRDVVAGAYLLREGGPAADTVALVTCGAMVPETLEAAALLAEEEGVEAAVVVLSSPGRTYRDWQKSRTRAVERGGATERSHIERIVSAGIPIVTVIDGASHALAWVGSALGSRAVALGVERFGQAGSQSELYAEHQIDPASIAIAALVALEP